MFRNFLRLFLVLAVVGFASQAQADLVADWSMDDASGATAVDVTGHGFDAATYNSITGYTAPTAGQAGKIGTAFLFAGGTSKNGLAAPYQSGSYTIGYSWSDATLAAWFNLNVGKANSQILGHDGPMSSQPGFFDLATNTTQGWGRFTGYKDPSSYTSGHSEADAKANISIGTWYQMTANFNRATNTARVYLNGVYAGTATNTSGYSFYNGTAATSMVTIGAAYWGSYNWNYFNGYIDDLGVWNELLDDAHVAALYNTPTLAGLNAPTTGHYGQLDMQTLFQVYTGAGPKTIGGLTWSYSAALPGYAGQTAGSAWYDAGTGSYNVLLGGGGGGVTTLIPEPSTLALLAAGLLGLLAYAWRKRK